MRYLLLAIVLLPFTWRMVESPSITVGVLIIAWFLCVIAFLMIIADVLTGLIVKDTRRKWDS